MLVEIFLKYLIVYILDKIFLKNIKTLTYPIDPS